MSLPEPVAYRSDVESRAEDEPQTIEELNETFDTILETTAENYDHAVRAVHAKSHGILEGEFVVAEDLAPELAQGLFQTPGTYKAYLRMSTNAGDLLPDAISLPRGVALKVCDVAGQRLPDADGRTQNFIMINAPVFQAPNGAAFLSKLKLLARTTDRMEDAKVAGSRILRGVNKALESVGVDIPAVKSLGGAPNVDPLGETYWSATAFRYGNAMAKFSLRPMTEAQKQLSGREIDTAGRENAIREEVRGQVTDTPLEWAFCVQLCRNLDDQPIEDPTVAWDEDKYPFERVATLRFPAQDSWAAERVEAVDEKMRFSVWTGLEAHRPLGSVNRVRQSTYRHSADFRARFNGCPYHEPG